jgi:hypothetical protein
MVRVTQGLTEEYYHHCCKGERLRSISKANKSIEAYSYQRAKILE